ncbi:isopenicillin N synthase family oxygenase [Maribius pontilimi]|uniref:2-oxoglutarate-dependent ethylene/succinate-forming enzyme n=1 Tax=Palleronia pontilimi TaxID=1964209 RepID=A0A934MCY7_9RHOB|nr:isopenicillin N synthase family oxygenase [Palleronia pontilimi]
MIPRIDAACLTDPDHARCGDVSAQMLEAATDVGFMTVHNTALCRADVEAVLEAYRSFFHLPRAQKAKIDMAATGSNRGWGAPGAERVDPDANPDFKQVFDMGFELPATDPLAAHGLKYYAPNRWPDGMPEFRATLEAYYAKALDVSMLLLRALARAMGQPEDSFGAAFDRPMALLRGNFYPERPDWAGAKDFGIATHTDYGCLTLLATDGTPGLEVRRRGGGWIPLSAPPGEFIVNFGEMLEMWTGGRVRATPHRVVGTTAERISVPLFFNPNYDTNVAPPGSDQVILAGDHLSRRYDETYVHLADKTGRT